VSIVVWARHAGDTVLRAPVSGWNLGRQSGDDASVRPVWLGRAAIEGDLSVRGLLTGAVGTAPPILPTVDGLRHRVRTEEARFAESIAERAAHDVTAAVRAEFVELHRILRQQGDAADEIAETLGRTIARLSAEVEALTEALHELHERVVRVETSA